MTKKDNILIIGAGLCGSLLALRLGQRGYNVRVIEMRPDLRKVDISAGRSINLAFSDRGIKTNVTLIFSAGQALLAAKAGATYCSPFLGRLDDISTDGLNLIDEIRQIYDNYGFETQILAASVRHTMHVVNCAKIGADVMTGPLSSILGLLKHPLTDIGIAQFIADYEKGNK